VSWITASCRIAPSLLLVVVCALAALAFPHGGRAAPTAFLVGVNDDSLKWGDDDGLVADGARAVGVTAFRVPVGWQAGERQLDPEAEAELGRVVAGAGDARVVVTLGWSGSTVPRSKDDRADYCAYGADLLQQFPQVNDLVVFNEVNKTMFWRPQFERGLAVAPRDYERLLAVCYDALHAVRPGVNVISSLSPRGNDNPRAVSNISISPLRFLASLGHAYRASGRRRPLFDSFGQNVYGSSSAEPPSRPHAGGTVGEGDYPRLMQALRLAFGGTRQPVPSASGPVKIWYLETGFQTQAPADKLSLYSGSESERRPLTPGRQAAQLQAALRIAACQPAVGALFNFELRDDPALAGWQSGFYYPDWTPKTNWSRFTSLATAAQAGHIRCDGL
jgi:hypothetical protein